MNRRTLLRTAGAPARVAHGPSPHDLTQPTAPPQWMTPEQMADYSKIPIPSLAKYRLTGMGPKYVKLGRRIRYRSDWCDIWMEAGTRKSTSDSGQAS